MVVIPAAIAFLAGGNAQLSFQQSRQKCNRSDAFGRGARVHSDSWGTSAVANYDAYAADFDTFTYNHPDFVPVVAAGNFGYQDVDSTVTSPALAKNCIAVGTPA